MKELNCRNLAVFQLIDINKFARRWSNQQTVESRRSTP